MLQTSHGALRVVGMALAVLVMTAGAAGAALTPQKPRTVPYTGTATCAQISQTGSTLVIVCADTSFTVGGISSKGEDGAAVATITLNGTHGTSTAIGYFANGVRRSKETFTVATDATGMATLTGSGTCTGGTGFWKHAKCSYTLTGTTNTKTLVGTSKEVGTITR